MIKQKQNTLKSTKQPSKHSRGLTGWDKKNPTKKFASMDSTLYKKYFIL